MFFPSQVGEPDLRRREPPHHRLLLRSGRGLNAVITRIAELANEFAVDLAGIAARLGRDLRREQSRDDPVFVRRPDAAVQTKERRAGALLATKAQRAIAQAIHEPLEADRHFVELPPQLRGDAVNIWLLTPVLRTAVSVRHFGRCWKR